MIFSEHVSSVFAINMTNLSLVEHLIIIKGSCLIPYRQLTSSCDNSIGTAAVVVEIDVWRKVEDRDGTGRTGQGRVTASGVPGLRASEVIIDSPTVEKKRSVSAVPAYTASRAGRSDPLHTRHSLHTARCTPLFQRWSAPIYLSYFSDSTE
ncbi:hypothetical protein J6590_066406 [Homalodisca vitripennis]|nr:hypothetical protein J6590_066406 [Homalodisca vitripennis]